MSAVFIRGNGGKETKIKTAADFAALKNDISQYVRAPAGLPGVKKGDKLHVLHSGITPETCPLGAGLFYHILDKEIRIVHTPKGIAWLAQ